MNTDERVADLLSRAQGNADTGQGLPSAEEIAWTLSTLKGDADTRTKDALILTLGYATYGQYKQALEPFLAGPDVELASTALRVICKHWELTGEYVETIRRFILGVPWDPEGKCQWEAITLAEEYMHLGTTDKPGARFEPSLISAMITVCEDESEDAKPWNQQAAGYALYRVLGNPDITWEQMLSAAKEHSEM